MIIKNKRKADKKQSNKLLRQKTEEKWIGNGIHDYCKKT